MLRNSGADGDLAAGGRLDDTIAVSITGGPTHQLIIDSSPMLIVGTWLRSDGWRAWFQ